MEIFETIPPFDTATHRQAATYTDTGDPGHDRIIRVWDVEPIPLEELRQARKSAATDLRWQKETGGIVIAGVPVATDDRSKTLILGRRAQAQSDPDMTFRWKAASGEWVELTGAQIIAIADAVADHVQACFDREGDLHDAIDTTETAEAVLAVNILAGWL